MGDSIAPQKAPLQASPEETASSSQVPPATNPAQDSHRHVSVFERWLRRIVMLLFVSVCAVFGVLLVILPWTSKWTDNYILISSPALRDFLEAGFVRGLCSGLGALDIWIGFWEAMHYHEEVFQA